MSTGPIGQPGRYPPDPRAVGEVPGYEFERPAAPARDFRAGVPSGLSDPLADPLRSLRPLPPAAAAGPPPLPVRVARGALAMMRERNWVTGLAIPILAAVIVGVAAVVVVGGSGGSGAAPSALDAGFPPARLAGADFTGATAASPAVFAAIAAAAGTEVAVGSAGGGPALWASANGGSSWARVSLTGAPARTGAAGRGVLAGVAHGAAGWLAVGTAPSGTAPPDSAAPLVASSPDGQRWTVAGGRTALPGAASAASAAAAAGGAATAGQAPVAAAVAAGPAGYVIVGHRPADGSSRAIAWYAPARGLRLAGLGAARWRRAVISRTGSGRVAGGAQQMNAVTATTGGFAAVGGAGTHPAAWLSVAGQTWRQVTLPRPAGAARAALTAVAASGAAVVAVGTAVSPAGAGSPFAAISADGGARWQLTPLPAPTAGWGAAGAGAAAATVTALSAAGRGFTATGSHGSPGAADVVVWTLPSVTPAGDGRTADGWSAATPQGTGLTGRGTQVITALTADGATLTGVGFTATAGVRQPTLWQSPIRN